jgi:hypothetical protein
MRAKLVRKDLPELQAQDLKVTKANEEKKATREIKVNQVLLAQQVHLELRVLQVLPVHKERRGQLVLLGRKVQQVRPDRMAQQEQLAQRETMVIPA